MTLDQDIAKHPLLEGKLIGFDRNECDGEEEVDTPYIVRIVGNQLEHIFSTDESVQDIHIPEVEDKLRAKIAELGITEIITLSGLSRGRTFLGITLDTGTSGPQEEETKSWTWYRGFSLMSGHEWVQFMRGIGVSVKCYSLDRKEFYDYPE